MTVDALLDLSPHHAIHVAAELADTTDPDRVEEFDAAPPADGWSVGAGLGRTYPREEF